MKKLESYAIDINSPIINKCTQENQDFYAAGHDDACIDIADKIKATLKELGQ